MNTTTAVKSSSYPVLKKKKKERRFTTGTNDYVTPMKRKTNPAIDTAWLF